MTIDLSNIWVLFISILSVIGPLLAAVVGFLAAGLVATLIVEFFDSVKHIIIKIAAPLWRTKTNGVGVKRS